MDRTEKQKKYRRHYDAGRRRHAPGDCDGGLPGIEHKHAHTAPVCGAALRLPLRPSLLLPEGGGRNETEENKGGEGSEGEETGRTLSRLNPRACMQVIAVVAMVGVSVARPRAAPSVLDSFDPVSRGVYGTPSCASTLCPWERAPGECDANNLLQLLLLSLPSRPPTTGPWHPVIRRQANQAFLRDHVFEGGLDSSVARARAKIGGRGMELTNAKV
jgi:hypothetical protein